MAHNHGNEYQVKIVARRLQKLPPQRNPTVPRKLMRLKSISSVKKTTAGAASIGCKVNQFQSDIDQVAPHGAPHVIALAPRTSGLIRVRRSSVLEGLRIF
jgi:hypothetical protein